MTLKYTTASAVKQKEGKLLCQPEVVCQGKANSGVWSTTVQCIGLSFLGVLNVLKSVATGVEVPRLNYDFNGKKHRFAYMTCVETTGTATKV